MKPAQLAVLVLLAALWGASFLFIRLAAPYLSPFWVVEGRRLVSLGLLLLFGLTLRQLPDWRQRWRAYLAVAFFNSALPHTLLAWAEHHLTASLASILNALSPISTALVAALWLKEALTPKRVLGLLLGVVGVGVIVGWSPVALDLYVVLAVLALVVTTFSYGVGGVYTRLTFQGTHPVALAVGQQLGVSLWAALPAALTLPAEPPPASALLAIVALGLFSTAVAYVLYFYLVQNAGVTQASSVTFLVPVFGLLWGSLFLNEPVSPGMLVGLLLIFSSILLVNEVRLRGSSR